MKAILTRRIENNRNVWPPLIRALTGRLGEEMLAEIENADHPDAREVTEPEARAFVDAANAAAPAPRVPPPEPEPDPDDAILADIEANGWAVLADSAKRDSALKALARRALRR